jgi:hypothetical protein
MHAQRVIAALVLIVACAAGASAQTRVAVNGVESPGPIAAVAGGTVPVDVINGPGNATDWIALATAGSANTSYLDWRYLNGSTAPPSTGAANATLTFGIPVTPGDYEFRLFASNGFTRVATSVVVSVSASAAEIAVNGIPPPATAEVFAGSTLSVDVSGGPANRGDWVGLFAVGAADGAYSTWRYLNGTTSLPAAGVSTASLVFDSPTSPGSYEFRLFANNTFARLTTSSTIVVSASATQIAVNGVTPPTAVSAAAGSSAVVAISSGPGNATDWIGLYESGAPNGAYLA